MTTNAPEEEYKHLIKAKYERIKNEDVSRMLSNPTPGNLKKLIVHHLEDGASHDDLITIKRFFDIKEGEDDIKQVTKFDRDKLLPTSNFLKGKTGDSTPLVMEIIALLVGFELRPFRKFRQSLEKESKTAKEEIKGGGKKTETTAEPGKDSPKPEIASLLTDIDKPRKSKFLLYTTFVLALCFIGYIAKKEFFPAKQCLQWNTDHYEVVTCEGKEQGFPLTDPIYTYDEDLLDFRKIEVSDTTTFFKDGQPIVWYSKQNNQCEFFNKPGMHPITGKPLLPVTSYIASKYVLDKAD
ncbi:MAG TPA: hypothetical protein VK528_07170 [Flavobacterium sp.]|nr:hypothetical protein [Flavobacterium sp.]